MLARSVHDACHAFRWGDAAWGVQFHPEFGTVHMRGYVQARADALAKEGRCAKRLASEVADRLSILFGSGNRASDRPGPSGERA